MALFGRRARASPGATNGTTTTTTTTKRRGFGLGRGGRGKRHQAYAMHTRPTFGQWLKVTWLDILTMVAMGAIGLGVSGAQICTQRI